MGHRRGRRCIDGHRPNLPPFDRLEDLPQAVQVHRFLQAVGQRLLHQGMVRGLHRTHVVIPTGELRGEHRGEQVLRPHALNRDRNLLSSLIA